MTQLSRNDDRCFGVEIGNEGLLKILNRGISVLGDGYAQSIAYRYTDELYSYSFGEMIRDHAAAFILVLLAIAALIFALLFRDIRRTRKEVSEKEAARMELEEKNRRLAESETALSEALARAEEASHAKTAFLNNMSHDMRTPMNAIVGFTDLALSHMDSGEEVREDLNRISVSSRHLLALINDVLDMSRIESGNVRIEEEDVRLSEAIGEIGLIVGQDVRAKGLRLTIDTDAVEHENVVTDKVRLNQVLLNVLSNAIKFTPEGGTITVKSAEGEGSEFIISIPFRISARPAGQPDAKATAGPGDYDFSGKRVLLAEDNEMNRMIAAAILEKAGFAVEDASDGQEAVEKVGAAPSGYYDIILMDVQMPVMDGHLAKPYDIPKMMEMMEQLLA